jgi:hypothetical protein
MLTSTLSQGEHNSVELFIPMSDIFHPTSARAIWGIYLSVGSGNLGFPVER